MNKHLLYLDGLEGTGLEGEVERRVAGLGLTVDGGAPLEKREARLAVVAHRSVVQRPLARIPVCVLGLDVRLRRMSTVISYEQQCGF